MDLVLFFWRLAVCACDTHKNRRPSRRSPSTAPPPTSPPQQQCAARRPVRLPLKKREVFFLADARSTYTCHIRSFRSLKLHKLVILLAKFPVPFGTNLPPREVRETQKSKLSHPLLIEEKLGYLSDLVYSSRNGWHSSAKGSLLYHMRL